MGMKMTIEFRKQLKIIASSFIASLMLINPAFSYEPAGTPSDWAPPVKRHNFGHFLVDRFESQWGDNEDGYVWDATAWYGSDVNRLWLKAEGEGELSEAPADAELQLLYGRLIAPFWDFQVGLRHDFRPNPDTSHLAIGLQGSVPYKFEVDAALFISEDGNSTVRVETEYELLLTQYWVLQPRFELNSSFSEDKKIGLRRGVNSTELGLRLRYEVAREFAPYVGVEWVQKYAGTADQARLQGESTHNTALVAGIRAWF